MIFDFDFCDCTRTHEERMMREDDFCEEEEREVFFSLLSFFLVRFFLGVTPKHSLCVDV